MLASNYCPGILNKTEGGMLLTLAFGRYMCLCMGRQNKNEGEKKQKTNHQQQQKTQPNNKKKVKK